MAESSFIDVMESICSESGVDFLPARKAGDIMNTHVRMLTLDDTVKKGLEAMKAFNVRHLAIVDTPSEGEKRPFFVGLVSQRDLLRLKAPEGKEAGRNGLYPKALRQLLGQAVARKPVSVTCKMPIAEAMGAMLSNHIDAVPVLQGDDVAGMITATDIVKELLRMGRALGELMDGGSCGEGEVWAEVSRVASRSVAEIMSRPVMCLEQTDTLIRAIELLKKAQFRHAVITDESGHLVGVVSDRDILRQLPYAGPRPPKASKQFRADLFRLPPCTRNLNITMQDIMTSEVTHIGCDCGVFEAAEMLVRLKVGCLPVVDAGNNIRGIVTPVDFMRTIAGLYEGAEESSRVRQRSDVT